MASKKNPDRIVGRTIRMPWRDWNKFDFAKPAKASTQQVVTTWIHQYLHKDIKVTPKQPSLFSDSDNDSKAVAPRLTSQQKRLIKLGEIYYRNIVLLKGYDNVDRHKLRQAVTARINGAGLNATARKFGISKPTISKYVKIARKKKQRNG